MGLLDELTGGGESQQQYQDFVNRYQEGPPHEGITDEEAGQRYNEVSGAVDHGTYQQAAQDSLANMPDEQRAQFAQQVQGLADQHGIQTGYNGATDPQSVAAMTSQVHQQNPGLLGTLLGMAPMAMGMMGGGAMMGGMPGMGGIPGMGGMGMPGGGNPIARAALGGIAAMAAQQLMSGGGGFRI